MESEILKMVSTGGSVVVLFASVIIFLKELGKRDEVIKALQAQSNGIFTEMRLANANQVSNMIAQMGEQQKYFQSQFIKLIDNNVSSSRELVMELKDLKAEIQKDRPR